MAATAVDTLVSKSWKGGRQTSDRAADDDDDIAAFRPTQDLSRRPSISSTAPSLATSAFTGIPDSLLDLDDNDAASSLAPFFGAESSDTSSTTTNRPAGQRRRSSLLRNALTALRRPSGAFPAAAAPLFTSALSGDLAQLTAYHAAGGALDVLTNQNLSALHLASAANQPAILEFLLSQPTIRPLINARSKRVNRSALDVAAASRALPCAQLLLSAGADLTARSKYDGATALHAAARACHVELISLFVDAGAGVNEPSLEGFYPLHWAVAGQYPAQRADAVGELLKRGAFVNARTEKGFTPVQRAVMMGDAEVVRVLVAHHHRDFSSRAVGDGGDDDEARANAGTSGAVKCSCVDIDGPFSMRAIHSAVFANRADILALLVAAGADVEARTLKGWTPLHVAARFGYVGCKRVLVEAGADETAVTIKGWTAGEVARRWGTEW